MTIYTAYNPRMIGLGTVAPAMSTAARWGVLGFTWYTDTFFSAAASRRYRAIGQCIGFAAVVAVALGMTARIYLQSWVDAEVAAVPLKDAAPVLVDPFAPDTNPVPTARPVANQPTLAQLRKRCIDHNKALPAGDPRRIVGAARLTKAEAIAALGKV
jgi:hypothetical protein